MKRVQPQQTRVNTYTLQPSRYYRKYFQGSGRLFRASWGQYTRYLQGSIDDPRDDQDVISWLDTIAADKVNDSRSTFYMRG